MAETATVEKPQSAKVPEVDEFEDDEYVLNIFSLYLGEASKYKLLTAEEERNLAILIEEGKKAEENLKNIRELDDPNEAIRCRKVVADGKAAKDLFISSNLRLVIKIAKKYSFGSINVMDLIQEGNLGLMKAVDRFEYRRGYKFSTYATWWIKQAILHSITNKENVIRLPAHVKESSNKLKRLIALWVQEYGEEPKVSDLAAMMDLPEKKIRELLKVSQDVLSLDSPLDDEDACSRLDLVEDMNAPSPERETDAHLLRELLVEILKDLPLRERSVIMERYGLGTTGKKQTLEEVSKRFHLTRERIRQIEKRAMELIMEHEKSEELRSFIAD